MSDLPAADAILTILDQCLPGMPPGRFRQPLTVDVDSPSPSATGFVPPLASITEPHVCESVFMPPECVRTVRTCQEFATCETTSAPLRGAISAMIDDPKTIAKRLKNLREALGFDSQVAFAKELGIGRNTYNPFEKGTRELTFETACLIRAKFRIPIDWLFWGEDDELPYHIKVKLEARRQAA
ncbi:helix-turn-helix transcriptional regulator [Bradyrhizobium sp. I71]|uniref:helix-turn-helix domain-containing protein n=1 Tax=Bradyrhizobium sp. I71 TaxID=2590772 RepID=UPI001EF9752F|nr:helix-turn-helix transcriptional regulator [Bradyrhizobium sp. I71]